MSDVFNVRGDDWEAQSEREGYRHRSVAIGKRIGGELLGASLYELPPGERSWPYHYETVSEEWLLVVSGRPTLRGPDGERELREGDVVAFPRDTGKLGVWTAEKGYVALTREQPDVDYWDVEEP